MGVLRQSGSARLNLSTAAPRPAVQDPLLEAVREAASGEFDVLGEIGRSPGGIAYLARDLSGKQLVALRLTRSGAEDDYLLEVADRLDVAMPARPTTCPRCAAAVRGRERFCGHCGANLGSDRSAGDRWTKADLLTAAQLASRGKFEILGELSRTETGDIVYFARDVETGTIAALRLQQEGEHDYSIGLTDVLQRFAASIATHRQQPGR